MSTHPRRLRARGLAAAATLTLMLGACSGDDEPASPETRATQTTENGTTLEATSPLTGLTLDKGLPRRPVVVVKIDNTSSSRPQLGLGGADLVVQQLVEGGITRLAAFFYHRVPDVVGPVRSMRASDIGIVGPTKGVLVASGGAAQTVARVRGADITMVTEGGPGFYRESSRSSLYSLMVRLPDLLDSLGRGDAPPEYLPFGEPDSLPRGKPARGLTARFAGGSASEWRYTGGRYVNTNSYAADGDQFEPQTVLVLRVDIGDAGYLDPAGNPVPETKLTGGGPALVFHGGRVVRGTWAKDSLAGELRLRSAGRSLELPPGKAWIELVPKTGGDVAVQAR